MVVFSDHEDKTEWLKQIGVCTEVSDRLATLLTLFRILTFRQNAESLRIKHRLLYLREKHGRQARVGNRVNLHQHTDVCTDPERAS